MTNDALPEDAAAAPADAKSEHESLKYSLLGPSLTKAGQDKVDQSKVSEVIYAASKGSKYFTREEEKDAILTTKITALLSKKAHLESSLSLLTRPLRAADTLISTLELSRDLSQHIVHVDCDAFYAAVEQLDRPELSEKPFAVGAGVLTTCNYVARKFGCRSGMAGFVAKKLCPEIILLKPNFEKYTAKAREVRTVLARYDPRFESASVDEAYLNITAYCVEHNIGPEDAVRQMREEVHRETRVTVSAGIAANAKLAKICSNMNKPNGQYALPRERGVIMRFMRDLPVRKVNGVGRVFERELDAVGVRTCGDIYAARALLAPLFGDKAAEFLFGVYLGLGRTNVQPAEEYERKSVGTESTFHDLSDRDELRAKLKATAEELERDMRRVEMKGRTLCLKVKLHTYEVFTRQVGLPRATERAEELYNAAVPMLAKLEQEMPGMKLRLMGLRCTHLVSMKKVDGMAFFGFKRRKTEVQAGEARAPVEDEWEQWPDEILLDQEHDGMPTMEASIHQHGKEVLPNPKPPEKAEEPEEEWWDCPICGRPQQPDERLFNEHIDLCLSRQTIREAVQDAAGAGAGSNNRDSTPKTGGSRSITPESRKTKEKKRGRPAAAPDPRQKRLCFG